MKRFSALMGLILASVLVLGACSAPGNGASSTTSAAEAAAGSYHKITAEQAKERMEQGGVTVVDVRRAEEYAQKHIPGAILVPNESIGGEPPAALPDKDAVLLVYCRTGVRSKQASDKLVKLGYTQVYDFGGIADWPYETQSGDSR